MNASDLDFLEEHPDFGTSHLFFPPSCSYADLRFFDERLLRDPANRSRIDALFLARLKQKTFSVLWNPVDKKFIFPISPFRGNEAYARKKHKRLQPLIDTYGDRDFSVAVGKSRGTELRKVSALLLTFTFAREGGSAELLTHGFPVKRWNAWDAWEALKGSKSLLNQFKVELSRIVGSTYGSCTVKEGCRDDYPAPHMIVLLDHPVLAHRYGKTWLLGGGATDRKMVDKIQEAWERIAGSYCKVSPIVGKEGFAYVFKYIQKSVDSSVASVSELSPEQLTCFNTHRNQALHHLNDVVSPAFRQRLGVLDEQLNLLDTDRKELKQNIRERDRLLAVIDAKGGLGVLKFLPEASRYWEVCAAIERLRRSIEDLKLEFSPWFYLRGGFSGIEEAQAFAVSSGFVEV